MSKTRRQRATDHPGLPKKGIRDPNRQPKNPAAVAMGKLGGSAPHKLRGFQTWDKEKLQAMAKQREANKNKTLMIKEVT